MEDVIQEAGRLREEAEKELKEVLSLPSLQEWRNRHLSKKAPLSALMGRLREASPEERGRLGAFLNEARRSLESLFQEKERALREEELARKLEEERVDVTLPGRRDGVGAINPFRLIEDEIVSIFTEMGYRVEEGHDVETERYNFELLNMPEDHPARDMQDTFYLEGEGLLRTQTSASQAHVLEENEEKGPLAIISPGKCYRRDDDDMTHSHQFGQVEGLLVGEGVSMADLKGTLALFARKMFGKKREIRLRSSYFPFTEPSVEVDVSCARCEGKGCPMCKGTGWIEILGAGEVHPDVLRKGGYDPERYQGFAFGVGIERVAMLRYGIDDIRRFYQDDARFLAGFHEEE